MKITVRRILPVVLGAAGFALRLLQQQTAFEPDTGLSLPGAAASWAMGLYLAAAGALLLILALREAPEKKMDLAAGFHTPTQKMLPILVCAAMIVTAGGVLLFREGLSARDFPTMMPLWRGCACSWA